MLRVTLLDALRKFGLDLRPHVMDVDGLAVEHRLGRPGSPRLDRQFLAIATWDRSVVTPPVEDIVPRRGKSCASVASHSRAAFSATASSTG